MPDGKLNIAMKTVEFSAINTISYLTVFPMYEILLRLKDKGTKQHVGIASRFKHE